jgi:DNA invertase Pin-like site-specific DNA recombinase
MARKTDPEQYRILVKKLPDLIDEGLKLKEIATRFGVSKSLVFRIQNGQHPKWYLKEINDVKTN